MTRYIANIILNMLPISSFFKLKCLLFNLSNMKLEKGVCVNGHSWFYGRGEVNVGKNTWIGPRCRFYSDESVTITVGKNCDIAPEVAFVVGSHDIADEERRAGRGYCESIIVEDGCWIGARVTILGGVTIGKGSVIGAGSLVIKDVPANSVVAGVPAKVIRHLEGACEEA